MKIKILTFLLVIVVLLPIEACSGQQNKHYNINDTVKAEAKSIMQEIEKDQTLSEPIPTHVETFCNTILNNANYTNDEKMMVKSIMEYYGNLLLKNQNQLLSQLKGKEANTKEQQKDIDKAKKQIEQYLK